ncbi:hypothetical protein Sfum_3513 [Syntrophobacter fumaroxidans MPOB]|uniref:Uncharacterized protein n=1 Tax=Syntrophobacter fumaroxidans (strain DSM 10017 / MPOB) TaxID=335543 RepID=A0LP32_SYNFM|nr:hypothetical protein Sfum_3513 [Syntrophobacter fumaroxidans MPOB]
MRTARSRADRGKSPRENRGSNLARGVACLRAPKFAFKEHPDHHPRRVATGSWTEAGHPALRSFEIETLRRRRGCSFSDDAEPGSRVGEETSSFTRKTPWDPVNYTEKQTPGGVCFHALRGGAGAWTIVFLVPA